MSQVYRMAKVQPVNQGMRTIPQKGCLLAKRALALFKHAKKIQILRQIGAKTGLPYNESEELTRPSNAQDQESLANKKLRETGTDHDTRQDFVSVLLSKRNLGILKAAVLAGRELELETTVLRAKVYRIDRKVNQLNRAIVDLDGREEEFSIDETVSEKAQRLCMLQRVDRMRDKRNGLKQQLQDLKQALTEVYGNFEIDQDILLPELDSMLVRSQLLPPPAEIDTPDVIDDTSAVESLDNESERARSAVFRRDVPEEDHSQQSSSHTLRRKNGVEGLRETFSPADEFVLEVKSDLFRKYKFGRLCLRQAEADFEGRYDIFDTQHEELVKARNAGDTSESLTELGLRQFQATQNLTRALAEAEEKFYAAKEAAVLGGVSLARSDSDLESGFEDHASDGYRLSEDKEIIATTDRTVIQLWLDAVPDYVPESCTSHPVSEMSSSYAINVELDEWNAKPIEWENLSAVAEMCSDRRRIDRWNLMCGRER